MAVSRTMMDVLIEAAAGILRDLERSGSKSDKSNGD
jgi:hypothetical protein